jgi:hypothetical protein
MLQLSLQHDRNNTFSSMQVDPPHVVSGDFHVTRVKILVNMQPHRQQNSWRHALRTITCLNLSQALHQAQLHGCQPAWVHQVDLKHELLLCHPCLVFLFSYS